MGLIVPVSIFGVDGFSSIQELTLQNINPLWISCFANRPAQLFDGAQRRLTIILGNRSSNHPPSIYTSRYYRWRRDERGTLFPAKVQYGNNSSPFLVFPTSLEKLGSPQEVQTFSKIVAVRPTLASALVGSSLHQIFYTRRFGYFLAFLDGAPRVTEISTGKPRLPSELKTLALTSNKAVYCTIAGLSSSIFFWFWNVLSDCRNLNRRDILAFPLCPQSLPTATQNRLAILGERYLSTLKGTSQFMIKSGLKIETFNYSICKSILDEIDITLAKLYRFSDEEVDFILNYDIKYRMGQDDVNDTE